MLILHNIFNRPNFLQDADFSHVQDKKSCHLHERYFANLQFVSERCSNLFEVKLLNKNGLL